MNIRSATRQYEAWLGRHVPLVRPDVVRKHGEMARHVFAFFRATYYRWLQHWHSVVSDSARAPVVQAVGDLHVENFGTWRDSEGRLVWGINDFDEAARLPYTHDLVRLATSAALAIDADDLAIKPKEACEAILIGYKESLAVGGQPYVLAERHRWLREIATGKARNHITFWKKLNRLPRVRRPLPRSARQALEQLLPRAQLPYIVRHRVSGLGSLGRPRFVAIAQWQGGQIAREAKALAPSALAWAEPRTSTAILYQSMLDRAVRCPDPYVRVHGIWLVRRLSPYCSRIDLSSLPKKRDEGRLLYAMGWETANIHLGSFDMMKKVLADLDHRKPGWLRAATKPLAAAVHEDWKNWLVR